MKMFVENEHSLGTFALYYEVRAVVGTNHTCRACCPPSPLELHPASTALVVAFDFITFLSSVLRNALADVN